MIFRVSAESMTIFTRSRIKTLKHVVAPATNEKPKYDKRKINMIMNLISVFLNFLINLTFFKGQQFKLNYQPLKIK